MDNRERQRREFIWAGRNAKPPSTAAESYSIAKNNSIADHGPIADSYSVACDDSIAEADTITKDEKIAAGGPKKSLDTRGNRCRDSGLAMIRKVLQTENRKG